MTPILRYCFPVLAMTVGAGLFARIAWFTRQEQAVIFTSGTALAVWVLTRGLPLAISVVLIVWAAREISVLRALRFLPGKPPPPVIPWELVRNTLIVAYPQGCPLLELMEKHPAIAALVLTGVQTGETDADIYEAMSAIEEEGMTDEKFCDILGQVEDSIPQARELYREAPPVIEPKDGIQKPHIPS